MLVDGGYLLQLLAACRKGMKQQQERLLLQHLLEPSVVIPEVQVCESLALAICDLLQSQYDQQLHELLDPMANEPQRRRERTLKITLDKLVLANLELGFKKEAGCVLLVFALLLLLNVGMLMQCCFAVETSVSNLLLLPCVCWCRLLLQQEAFRCLAMELDVKEVYSESGIDRLCLGLQVSYTECTDGEECLFLVCLGPLCMRLRRFTLHAPVGSCLYCVSCVLYCFSSC